MNPLPEACQRCSHYFPATPDGRTSPGDQAECGAPMGGNLRTWTMNHRGPITRCRAFAPRYLGAVGVKDVLELAEDHAWRVWFAHEVDITMGIPVASVGPEGSLSNFDRFIAGDR